MRREITRIKTLGDLEKLSAKEKKVFELMADLEHQRWAGWQEYLHSKCTRDEDGNLVIPKGYVDNLERQIRTSFKDLTKKEQDSDREEALKTWEVIAELYE
jgi:hypothetical protein